MIPRPGYALLLACAALAACFGGGGDASRFGNLPSDSTPLVLDSTDLMITNADTSMELGVVGDKVVMRISQHLREQMRRAMDSASNRSGIGASIARMALGKVGEMLNHRLEYAVADIDSVDYTGDRLVFHYKTEQAMTFEKFNSDHRPVLESFKSEDAMHFVEVFRAHKARPTPPL